MVITVESDRNCWCVTSFSLISQWRYFTKQHKKLCVFLINFFHPNEIKLILASGHTHLTRLPWFHIVQGLGRSSGCRPVGCAFGRTWQSYSTGCKCANGVMASGHFLATVSHATCVLCCFKNAPVHQLRWPWFKCRRWGRFLGSFRLLHWKLVTWGLMCLC